MNARATWTRTLASCCETGRPSQKPMPPTSWCHRYEIVKSAPVPSSAVCPEREYPVLHYRAIPIRETCLPGCGETIYPAIFRLPLASFHCGSEMVLPFQIFAVALSWRIIFMRANALVELSFS